MITAHYLLMKGLKEMLLVKRTAIFQEVIQVPRLLPFCDSAIKKKKHGKLKVKAIQLSGFSLLNLRAASSRTVSSLLPSHLPT